MKIISFVSLKGGVAKTTSGISFSEILSERGKTLLIDMDPQGATTSHFIDDIDSITGKTVHQALLGLLPLEGCIRQQSENLYIVPSEIELAHAEIEMQSRPNSVFTLFEALEEIASQFEYCVIDTPGALGLLTNMAVFASDLVIIPTQLEKWPARAVGATITGIEPCRSAQRYIAKSFQTRILPTFWEDNRKIKAVMLDILRQSFGEAVTSAKIHTSTDVSRTYAQSREFLPRSSRARAEYRALVDEMGGLI